MAHVVRSDLSCGFSQRLEHALILAVEEDVGRSRRSAEEVAERRRAAEAALSKAQCPVVEIRTDRPYVPALMRHFKARKRQGVA